MDLASTSFAELQALQTSGEVTAVDLVRAHLEQIARLDPMVRAVIERNPDAEAIAQSLDEERASGVTRGPLHGVPILVKDNIDTADRMMTTAGSIALVDSIAPADAPLVTGLRQAGAVLLGKTNLSEWANMRSSRSSTGWSSRGGQTRNAYAADRSPGGSSSGSGVAVACSMCAAAIGTETDGSVVIPSAMNSLVGIKPTLGRVSGAGIIPIAHSQDTAGPMARSVRDAALLLGAIADPRYSSPGARAAPAPMRDVLERGERALEGARVGLVRNYCGFHEGVDVIVAESVSALRECGAEVVDEVEMIPADELRAIDEDVMLYELKHDLNAYLAGRGPDLSIRTLADLIEFNEQHAQHVMPYFGQEHFLAAQEKGGLDEPAYREALAAIKRLSGPEGIDAALAAHELDCLLAPTIGAPWSIDLVNGDHRSPCSSAPAALAGYPSVSVPGGYLHGLPVGMSFFGAADQDARLIGFAYAFERMTQVRRPPDIAL